MDNKQAKIFAAELGGKMPELDLHGFYPNEAQEKLELFIFDCYKKQENKARVIYGFGTGKLRTVVLDYLSMHPLVEEQVEADGSVVVFVKNA